MAKTKKKHKEGLGPASSLEENPTLATLAAALARPGKSSRDGEPSAPPPISVKHVEIEGRSIDVMFRNESPIVSEDAGSEDDNEGPQNTNDLLEQGPDGEGSETQSEALGDEDSFSSLDVRRNAQLKTGNAQCEPSAAGEDRTMGKATQGVMKKPFVSLFKNNRLPSNGSKLEFYNLDEGPIILGEEDIQSSNFPWERCLVGYFGGKFPGKQPLNQIVTSWKVLLPNIQFHGSGWIIFQFSSKEDQEKVMENGPYIIYGSPLLLKPMPKYFTFGKEAISCFPVWVQLRSVPMIVWNPMVFGKICSKIGRPLHTDKLTAQRERVKYARCLVEVDMAKDLVHSVMLKMPDGGDYEQKIYYENLPRYCPLCRVVGHTKESCKVKPTNSSKVAIPKLTEANTNPTTEGSEEGRKPQQEWQIKQSKAPRGMEVGKAPESSNPLPAAPEVPEATRSLSVHPEPSSEHPVPNPPPAVPEEGEGSVQSEPSPEMEKEGRMGTQQASQNPSGNPGQLGREIYIQQGIQVASSKLQLVSKSLNGNAPTGGLKKGSSLVTRKQPIVPTAAKAPDKIVPSNSTSTPQPPTLVKGEEGRKKKGKGNQDRTGKQISLAEFCADMGGDSPPPSIVK